MENTIFRRIFDPKMLSADNFAGLNPAELLVCIEDQVKWALYDSGISEKIKITDRSLNGSRIAGLQKKFSDIDFVFSYEGDYKEDDLFNIIDGYHIKINAISIDINPICAKNLNEYLYHAASYLAERELKAQQVFQYTLKNAYYVSECKESPDHAYVFEKLSYEDAKTIYKDIPETKLHKSLGIEIDHEKVNLLSEVGIEKNIIQTMPDEVKKELKSLLKDFESYPKVMDVVTPVPVMKPSFSR